MLVGFGQANITPYGGKIAVAGSIPPRLTDCVHDEIQAVAMVIGVGVERTIWVCCDICHPTRVLFQDVSKRLLQIFPDFTEEQLVLSATHASACTRLSEDFLAVSIITPNEQMLPFHVARQYVCDGIVRAVEIAQNNLMDCSVSYSKADIITGLCRRVMYRDGSAKMYGKTDREDFWKMEYPDSGPTQMLYFHSTQDHALVGVLACVPCPAQADEASGYITADYWGIVRERVKVAFGSQVTVLGVCASAGELAPKRLLRTGCSIINGPQRAVELGEQVSNSIIDCYNNPLADYVDDRLIYRRVSFNINFPVRKPTSLDLEKSMQYFSDKDNFDENGYPRKMILYTTHKYTQQVSLMQKDFHTAQISVLRIGEVLIFTSPVELFTEYSKQICSQFPAFPILDVQLTNDNLGYLPTKEAIEHGGYSTYLFNTLTGYDGGELLVRTVCDQLKNLII